MSDPIPPAPVSEPAVSSLPGPFVADSAAAAPVQETVSSPPPVFPPVPVSQPPAPAAAPPAQPAAEAAPQDQPVMKAARQAGIITGPIGTLAAALTAFGVTNGQQWAVSAGAIVGAIAAFLSWYLPGLTAQGAAAQVTPLSSPRGVDGTPLVPAPRP